MAIDTVPSVQRGEPPSPDTALLWLTHTIESDFIKRRALPLLRSANAASRRGAATLHLVSIDQAESLLEDARSALDGSTGSTRYAYRAHISNLERAIKEAEERRIAFASHGATCIDQSTTDERWHGTREQLRNHGIQHDGPWPHEQGGKRWVQARDHRGYKVRITRWDHWSIWPGRYEAFIEIPYEVRAAELEDARNKKAQKLAEQARQQLEDMPTSAAAYRRRLVHQLRSMVRAVLDSRTVSDGGYTLDADAEESIFASFDAMADAVMAVSVRLDEARQAEIRLQYRAEIAAADSAFQGQLAGLTRPNPRLLEGGAR